MTAVALSDKISGCDFTRRDDRFAIAKPTQTAQRVAAATKRSRRNHCPCCRNSDVSRRAEKGDLVAWGEMLVGSADEQF